jgi:hypothetical protein
MFVYTYLHGLLFPAAPQPANRVVHAPVQIYWIGAKNCLGSSVVPTTDPTQYLTPRIVNNSVEWVVDCTANYYTLNVLSSAAYAKVTLVGVCEQLKLATAAYFVIVRDPILADKLLKAIKHEGDTSEVLSAVANVFSTAYGDTDAVVGELVGLVDYVLPVL